MALDTPSAACTIRGARQFGSTVEAASLSGPTPTTRAARHIVLVQFAERGRARQAHKVRKIDDRHGDDGVGKLGPSTATTSTASTKLGTAMIKSIKTRDGDIGDWAGHRRSEPERHADNEGHAHHGEADE